MDSRPFNPDLLQSLSPVGRALFSKFGRGPTIEVPFKCVHEAFEFHARTEPEEFAVEDGQVKVTYAELDRQANCLAAHLREKDVMPGTRVGLLVERSVFMVVGILAVLKAGGAYVPLDGNTISKSGLAHALRDSDASLVLLQRKFADKVFMIPTICIEDIVCSTPSDHCVKPEDMSSPGDSACILYTNGTADDADGVDVMHRNITNLVCLAPGNLAMSPGMRVAQTMAISSDMGAWEILGSLCNGSTLCLRGKTAKEWRSVVRTVDIMITTPSLLAPHDPTEYPNMKVVAVAGEHCPKRLADTWAECVDFYNCCGPAEITIVNTMHLHNPAEGLGIGVPIPNTTVYLLDEHLMPVKIGDVGVIWAGGAGITRGYVNNTIKTAERYLRDPFVNDGSMMFNTGDLARWHPDGNLEHLGRVDHQVKIKGFKIELDRIAGAIETTPGVKSAAAIMIEGDIWGFYTPVNIAVEAVKKSTAQAIPHYGMPSKFMALEKFPETANGKIDKKALQDLAIHSPEFEPYTPIPDASATPEISVPQVPIFPLLVGGEKAEKSLRPAPAESPEWNVSAGATKRPPVKRKSPPPPPSPVMAPPFRAPTPPRPSPFSSPSSSPSSSPPPIPARSLRREHLGPRKGLGERPEPESTYSDLSQGFEIPSPQLSIHNQLPDVSEERPPLREWDNVSRVSPTPTWVNNETMSVETHVGTIFEVPVKKEMTSSEMEDQTSIWSGLDQGVLPEKNDRRIVRVLRHRIFTTWARLFSLVFFINFWIFIAAAANRWSAYEISKGVFGNLFLASLMRQDYLIDGLFFLATRTPANWPLWARKITVDVHQLGGVHAGAASSSALWFLLYTGKATRESVMQSQLGEKAAAGTVAIAWFTLFLLLGTLTFAYPKIQDRFRHSFETIHRYCAWGIIILLWIEVPLLANDYRKPGVPLHVAIRECSAFWLLLLTTVSMIVPWVRLRKVAVYSKRLSPQAVRLYFDYATPQPGSIVKVSDDLLTEWHNFPAVCEPGNPGFSVVLAKGGYWTSTQVANPPSKLWVRGVPFYGIMRLVPVFQKIVLVATGCGIANCMPVVLERRIPIRLLWIAPNVRQVYGDKLVDSIMDANPAALILNTRKGDPDLVKMAYRLAKETEAEAVIIVSNKRITEKVVYGLTSRGVPAYGSICIEEP